MGRGAFGFILEFAVALPDDTTVLVIGVPHLGAVYAAAVAADDPDLSAEAVRRGRADSEAAESDSAKI